MRNAFAGDDDAMLQVEDTIRCQIQPPIKLGENSALHRPLDDLMVDSALSQFGRGEDCPSLGQRAKAL